MGVSSLQVLVTVDFVQRELGRQWRKDGSHSAFVVVSLSMPGRETRWIIFQGDPACAPALAQSLREQGVEVVWERPAERPRVEETAQQEVLIDIVVSGPFTAMLAGVKKFRERFGDGARVSIEGEDDTGAGEE